jgi:hypothetical protein
MNKRLLPFWAFLILLSLQSRAQVNPPCPTPPPPGAENCQGSCVYCDFDGYMGSNNGTPSGGNVVCGQIALHNDQWFGFTAGSTSITITIYPSNCEDGNGLQVAFWDDCSDSDAIVCDPGSIGGGNQPMVLTWDGFTIGETYFYMLDGWSGDVCDFEIEITEGSITPPPPGPSNQPQGPSNVCPGATAVYSINDVFGAGNYIWSAPAGSQINGMGASLNIDAPEGTTVTITFGNISGNVCVQADNACNPPSAQNCLPIVNQPIPPTVRPSMVICYEDVPFIWDEEPYPTLSVPGTFTLTSAPYESFLGCDSLVKQTIVVKQIAPTNMGTKYVCAGDCFMLEGDSYCDPGNYNVVFESFQGCDSLVNFALVVLNPVAVIPPPANAIDCNSAGVLLTSTGSTPLGQSTYNWVNANWNFLSGSSTYNATLTGAYHLIVTSQAGGVQCRDTAGVVVTGNTIAPGAAVTGSNISCLTPQATLTGSSPTNGVNYTWSGPGIDAGNQFQQNPSVDQPGVYVLTVKNPTNGCTSSASVTVFGDFTPPAANAVGGVITCTQTSVTIDGITNVPASSWFWTGPGINAGNQTLENPNVDQSGSYAVTVTNTTNGCTNTATAMVDLNNTDPTASAGPDLTLTCTAPNAILQGAGNGGGQPVSFSWTGPSGFMSNVAQPTVNVAGMYTLTVLNTLSGCLRKDTVDISANLVLPVANAGADSTINCAHPNITLIGSASSNGPNYMVIWSGPGIHAGNSNQYDPKVDQQGNYNLLITNTTNGCTATDQVEVFLNTSLPTANAGADDLLTCTSTNGVTLNGSGFPATVTFFWMGPGIGSDNDTLQTPTVTQPGLYELKVTNPGNGCTSIDQVTVSQDANVPTAAGGPDQVLNCSVFSVDFDALASTSGPGISYSWTGPGISGTNATAQSPTGLTEPGTYNFTVTNSNNSCINTDVVVILLDTIHPNADAGNDLILNCFNNASDTLDASGSTLSSLTTLLWSGPGIHAGNQNVVYPVLTNDPGIYTLVVTNTHNTCTAIDQVFVNTDLVAPLAEAGNDQFVDCVITTTSIGGNASSGANFSYLWSGPDINAANEGQVMPNVSIPGTYTILVTNTDNGCTASNDVVVNTNAVFPTAQAGNDGLLTCTNSSITLDGTASSTGINFQSLWQGPGINVSNQNQISPVVAVPGNYILEVQDITNSCITRDTVVIDENVAIPAANAGPDLILDCQTISTTLDGSFSAMSPTIVYLWAGPGINASNQNNQNPPVDQPGAYALLLTDTANGCTSSDQMTVVQDIAVPTASAGTDMLITCANVTQTLNGSGSSMGTLFSYVWQGPGINSGNFNLSSPTVDASGTYTLTVENSQNYCTATDVVFVASNETPPLTAGGPDRTLTCAVTTVQLDATQSAAGPNISFAWDGPGVVSGSANSATPMVNLSGVYVLTVTDATNGCTNVDAVNVGEDVILPTVLAGNDLEITCNNVLQGVVLSAAGSNTGVNFTLLWSGPGITPANQNQTNPTVFLPGAYTLAVTNISNGCVNTDGAVVNSDQNPPVANAGPDQMITCAVPNPALDGTGSSALSGTLLFLWSGPGINPGNQNGDMPTILQSGTYQLTVTNAVTGCSATDLVVVGLDNLPPAVGATSEILTCLDQVSTVTVNSSLSGASYLWEGPDVNQNNKDDQTLQVDVAGIYVVTVTAPNGCTVTTSTLVVEDSNLPQGNVEGSELNCFNNGATVISGQVDSPSGSTFTWTGPGIGTQATASVTVTQPGTYTFTIFAPNGCVRSFFADVTTDFVPPALNVVATEEIDCNTTAVLISGSGSSVGPNFSYFWTTNTGRFVSGTNTLEPIVDRAGFYTLRILNNLNGCERIDSVEVKIDPLVPTGFDLEVRNIRCYGDTNGSITVNRVQGGAQPFLFTLSGDSGSADDQYTGLPAGEYLLTLEDANGCHLDSTITIIDAGQLQVDLGPDISVSLGEFATITAQIQTLLGAQSVIWNYAPNCDTVSTFCETFTYQPQGTYRHKIEVIDLNGCIARDELLVLVQKNGQIYVPNIFNPDSEVNFSLGVHVGIDVAKIKSFNVFDRWGDQVFSLKEYIPTPGGEPDFGQSWDGNVRGEKGQVGVYVWYCEVEFIDGQTKIFRGDVTLIR